MTTEVEEFLSHYGVKGMKWGVRRDRDGVPKKTDREARKDAEEFARAKMFYGKGAGTRRKLIRESVAAKKKRNPAYAKAFEKHSEEQDLSEHASKATKERTRTDRKEKTKQRVGYLARTTTGEMGTQAAFAAAALGGAAYLKSPKGQATVRKYVNKAMDKKESFQRNRGADWIKDYLERNGM